MKKFVILCSIIALMAALIYWKKISTSHATVAVTSEKVTEQVLSDSILASGNLIFNTQIQIRSEITGIVTEVLVEEGNFVEKDQVLMQLDKTAFEADVASYQSAVTTQQIEIRHALEVTNDLKRQLKVKTKLYQQKLVGQEDLDKLTSQVEIAQINVDGAKEKLNQNLASLALAKDRLNKTTFRAAMPGLIAAVDVKPGETVIAGTTNIVGSALMTLADPTTILAELRIDEADIANVALSQTVKVYAASNPKSELLGKIVSIGTSARASNTSQGLHFRVKALLDTPERLFPGMSCRAEIITQQSESTLSVPIAAVHKKDNQHYVWLIKNNVASQKQVTIGLANDTHQAIETGLSLDDDVIVGPARAVSKLADGDAVKQKDS